MRVRHGPATVTGERAPVRSHCRWQGTGDGKAWGERGSGSQETGLSPVTRMGRGTPEEVCYGGKFPRAAHLFGRDASVELAGDSASAGDALRPSLGQWRAARSLARAGGGRGQLPARVRSRRASSARRSLPLTGLRISDRVLSAPGRGRGFAGRSSSRSFAFVTGEPLLDQAIGLEESNQRERQAFATHGYGGDGHTPDDGGETPSWSVQKVGLFFATGLSGAFVGGLFIALPAGVLWSFRFSSPGAQLVLWMVSDVVFGLLLCERANREELR